MRTRTETPLTLFSDRPFAGDRIGQASFLSFFSFFPSASAAVWGGRVASCLLPNWQYFARGVQRLSVGLSSDAPVRRPLPERLDLVGRSFVSPNRSSRIGANSMCAPVFVLGMYPFHFIVLCLLHPSAFHSVSSLSGGVEFISSSNYGSLSFSRPIPLGLFCLAMFEKSIDGLPVLQLTHAVWH